MFTAKLWLTCGVRLLLLSWRSPKGAVGNLFLNSCHHVRILANFFVAPFTMWGHLRTSSVAPVIMWGHSCTSELLRWPEWWELYTTSGQGSFRKRSPVGSRFSESLFLDVPGTATEQVRTCGFKKNLSNLDRAPNIPDSVRLNSFESFLVTLSSISSETWEM